MTIAFEGLRQHYLSLEKPIVHSEYQKRQEELNRIQQVVGKSLNPDSSAMVDLIQKERSFIEIILSKPKTPPGQKLFYQCMGVGSLILVVVIAAIAVLFIVQPPLGFIGGLLLLVLMFQGVPLGSLVMVFGYLSLPSERDYAFAEAEWKKAFDRAQAEYHVLQDRKKELLTRS